MTAGATTQRIATSQEHISRQLPAWLCALSVFGVALACRLVFNANLEHRVTEFGDAFYYLAAGTQLLLALKAGTLPALIAAHHGVALDVNSVTSLQLIDRLLIDGPVVPAYLAAVQFVLGLNPSAPEIGAHAFGIAACNSVVDALSCVLVYMIGQRLFGRRVAIIAGLLFATYPPAVINTATCYGEPICYFVLCVWLYALLSLGETSGWMRYTLLALTVGAATAIVMLSKPAFVLLPPVVAAAWIGAAWWNGRISRQAQHAVAHTTAASGARLTSGSCHAGENRHAQIRQYVDAAWAELDRTNWKRQSRLLAITLALAGFSMVVLPWLCFTSATTGKPSLFVNRVPAYNLYTGNRLASDGWRQYPMPYTPDSMPEATRMILEDARSHPADFVSMELRKVLRLWSGAWNTFDYDFLLNSKWQDVFHQLLLALGFVGFTLAVSGNGSNAETSRWRTGGLVLGSVVFFHFIYLAFEPISRYVATALPFVVVLAALAISRLAFDKIAPVASLLALLTLKRFVPSFVPLLASLRLGAGLRIIDAIAWVALAGAVAILLWRQTRRATASDSPASALLWCGWAMCAVVLTASSLGDMSATEISRRLQPQTPISRSVYLPDDVAANRTTYLLADLSSTTLTPPVVASINGRTLGKPMPWWQVHGDNKALLDALSVEAQAAGTNVYQARQWWAFPVVRGVLQPGQNTTSVSLDPKHADEAVSVFGDAEPLRLMPSLDRYSWTKCYATIMRGDCRMQEAAASSLASIVPTRLPTRLLIVTLSQNQGADEGESHASDKSHLSPSRVAVPPPAERILLDAPNTKLVSGAYPPSFFLTEHPLALPPELPTGTRFQLHAQIRGVGREPTCIAVTFAGSDSNGKIHEWTSPWQPGYIPVNRVWSDVSFGDRIPDEVLVLKGLSVKVMASPFPTDLLFVNRRKASKQTVELRGIQLKLTAGTSPDSAQSTQVRLY